MPPGSAVARRSSAFDVVGGAGTAGLTAALAASHEGAGVALVERDGSPGDRETGTSSAPRVASCPSVTAVSRSDPTMTRTRALAASR